MTLEEAIDESITKILEINPDLTYTEVYELCSKRPSDFGT